MEPSVATLTDAATVSSLPAATSVSIGERVTPEESREKLTEEVISKLMTIIKNVTTLFDLQEEDWNMDCEYVIEKFLNKSDQPILTIYFDQDDLKASLGFPECRVTDLHLYYRRNLKVDLDEHNFHNEVGWLTLDGNPEQSIYALMTGLQAPMMYTIKHWPNLIKNKFLLQFTKFLLDLAELKYNMLGLTGIHVPMEAYSITPEKAPSDRGLITRFNSVILQWYSHINANIKGLEAASMLDNPLPVDEYKFWVHRYDNLSGIWEQLGDPQVGHIVRILIAAQSEYVDRFIRMIRQLKEAIEIADSNRRYLHLLLEPCGLLEQATELDAIPGVLPHILFTFKFIWANSPHYNDDNLLIRQLQALCNQVVTKCKDTVNLRVVLDGKPRTGIKMFNKIVNCLDNFQTLYNRAVALHNQYHKKVWEVDTEKIFSQINTLKQRAEDVVHICEAMKTFGRIDEKVAIQKPTFGWTRASEYQKVVDLIEDKFNEHFMDVSKSQDALIELHSNTWPGAMFRFREGLREIEVIVENLLDNIFSTVKNVEEGVELLTILHHYSNSEQLRLTFEKRTTDVHKLFLKEIDEAKKEVMIGRRCHMRGTPRYGGRAVVAHQKKQRLKLLFKTINEAEWLPDTSLELELRENYHNLITDLNEYNDRLFEKWIRSVPDNFEQRLRKPLFARASTPYLIAINLDSSMREIASECEFWLQIGKGLPQHIMNYFRKRYHELCLLYNRVQALTFAHNRIILSLSNCEKLLFKEHLLFLRKQMASGFTETYNWVNDATTQYVEEATTFVTNMLDFVDDFKECNYYIRDLCHEMACVKLVEIETGTDYALYDFLESLTESRDKAIKTLSEKYKLINDFLLVVYDGFHGAQKKVKGYWMKYIESIDFLVEDAFLLCIVFSPTLLEIGSLLKGIFIGLASSLQIFPRITDKFKIKRLKKLAPIPAVITGDKDCQKINNSIEEVISTTYNNLQHYLDEWLAYRSIWETDRDLFFARFERRNPSKEAFSQEIDRYFAYARHIRDMDHLSHCNFLLINSMRLKETIIKHCEVWAKRLKYLLFKCTARHIEDVYKYCHQLGTKVNEEPQTLHDLPDALKLHSILLADIPKKEYWFPIIYDQFEMLLWYSDDVPDIIRERADGIKKIWTEYLESLNRAEDMLEISVASFKTTQLKEMADFKSDVSNLLKDFQNNAPFSADKSSYASLQWVKAFAETIREAQAREEELVNNLKIFKINQEPSSTLKSLDKMTEDLAVVWILGNEWDEQYSQYNLLHFKELDIDSMEIFANETYKKFTNLMKLFRDKNWPAIEQLRKKVDTFRRAIPMLADLKNQNLKKRHWDQIRDIVGVNFDETADDFTLEKIIKLGLIDFAEHIADISNSATMEVGIENQLKMIRITWQDADLNMEPHKDKGVYRLKAMDELFAQLEEHQNILSAMKGSRFAQPFIAEVDHWEKTLGLVLDVLEHALIVQKNYIYLENIFTGEDISKQLPKEADNFDRIAREWRFITKHMNKVKSAIKACSFPGLLKTEKKLIYGLEIIMRALEKYLETKRRVFPRFYFISNDDLLEILGSSKRQENIQPHFKKCFDNINKVKMQRLPNKVEGYGMSSADGEYVAFSKPISLEGPVEDWLCDLEDIMRITLRDQLKIVRVDLRMNLKNRDKWIMDHPGQLCITASQLQWTTDVTKTLQQCRSLENHAPMKRLKKKQMQVLLKFSDAVRSDLTKLQRVKIVAIVTIEIHAKDVIEKLYKGNTMSTQAFEWLSQLRFYWDKDINDCVVRQTNTFFAYGYEYLGNSGRLVITPLTDRCYITLTTALHLYRGGSPKGPAGTGKTETVKDLGKALAYYVIVINCSEGLDFKSMGRMFSGFAQSGAWGCFDEFNRINIEVLSVVAQQILSILAALAAKKKNFTFEGVSTKLVSTCGIFITMNPGYAGRTELPDNLKSMFRPISMMVPDSRLISEITLFGEGFRDTRNLANKCFTLFSLCKQQLSQQDHYEFGLRGLVALLRYSGKKRRQHSDLPEDQILLLAMKDMNVAKLTSDDLPLFNGVCKDLFPSVDVPTIEYSTLLKTVKEEMAKHKLQPVAIALTKIVQLYETKNSRHSTVILGQPGSAKTTTWKLLKNAMTILHSKGVAGFEHVQEYVINPKSVSLAELYGEYNLATNEWADGILSNVMRKACADEHSFEKWILFDGPVDAVWIENMNSVMDDNKVLTLINSERITLAEPVSLVFEVEDLSQASPATVSRCGIIFNDYKDFGWQPYVDSWLEHFSNNDVYQANMRKHFEVWVKPGLLFRRRKVHQTVVIPEICSVASLCKLLTALAPPTKCAKVGMTPQESYPLMTRLWFLFCFVWSIGAPINEDGRILFDKWLRKLASDIFPARDTVYDYCVSNKAREMHHWDTYLDPEWSFIPESTPFHKIIVPTVDTIRNEFLLSVLLGCGHPTLIVGIVGTGKTSAAIEALAGLDSTKYSTITLNMSSKTSSTIVQDTIESRLEKRTKTVFVPVGGKKMITFMDDFNMPEKEIYGAQPPLELIRQWIDHGFWYNRQNQQIIAVRDMHLLAAMGPPGGGRNVISNRLLSKFCILNLTFPTDSQILRIFNTMFSIHLDSVNASLSHLTKPITTMTLDLYKNVYRAMLPTPSKTHYIFNLRDISKVFQGLLRSHAEMKTDEMILKLWVHESFRVFHDLLNDDVDRRWFYDAVNLKLQEVFSMDIPTLNGPGSAGIFCDFMNQYGLYECIDDVQTLKTFIGQEMEEYNQAPGNSKLDLVFFTDAIVEICRIARIVSQPRGNSLIVALGGSGRQCIVRVAAWVSGLTTFKINISKNYRVAEFKEDLKRVYYSAGVKDVPTVFLMTDSQVTDEGFLELINSILSTGEVTKLYRPEEFDEIKKTLWDIARKQGLTLTSQEAINSYFIDRVRSNLHLALCMSPVGDIFRARLRQYPALVSRTTINWFTDWSQEALLEVAVKFLSDIDLLQTSTGKEMTVAAVAKIFSTIHVSVQMYSSIMLKELKRHNYVTPSSYLDVVQSYKKMLESKRIELSTAANKLRGGLSKIEETKNKVSGLTADLEEKNKEVYVATVECDVVMQKIMVDQKEADVAKKGVEIRSEKIAKEEQECDQQASEALELLGEAMPALEEAMQALEALNKKDIAEVRSYGKPPYKVEMVMEAVCILRGIEPVWAEAKKDLGDVNFLQKLRDFDKDHVTDRTLKRIALYTNNPEFEPEKVGVVSTAAKSLAMWVIAIEKYGKAYKIVAPRKAKWEEAVASLKAKQEMLRKEQENLEKILARVRELEALFTAKMRQKDDLLYQADKLRAKLERAFGLVDGLSGEKIRWERTVAELDDNYIFLPSDCLVSTAFVSYCGPFLSAYRDQLLDQWSNVMDDVDFSNSPGFDMLEFLEKPHIVRMWNKLGLPTDSFSTENAIIITQSRKWPLIIDPQAQAHKWIKNMCQKDPNIVLYVIDFGTPKYLQILEKCVKRGHTCLLQNINETIDPNVIPVLEKVIVRKGNEEFMKCGDRLLEYNSKFQFYITTKLTNPHYLPEIATRTAIVNFAIKLEGLEAQLLGIVVGKEKPKLEEEKDVMVTEIAEGRALLIELEDELLRLLTTATGSILDDEHLFKTLQTSKTTAINEYDSIAKRAALLFFVLKDMALVDPMYQFSLDSYKSLFEISIKKSKKSDDIKERIRLLNNYHSESVYRNTCRGLFERHKLMFSFLVCLKIMDDAVDKSDFMFLLKGGVVLNRDAQPDNPCPDWMSAEIWDNISELEKLPGYKGIGRSFTQHKKDWQGWYLKTEPETLSLIGEWETCLTQFQKLVILRCLRPDRLGFGIARWITACIGSQFTEPPVLDVASVLDDSSSSVPLVFVLSPGVDPTLSLMALAESRKMSKKFRTLSLGQGQAPIATKMIEDGVRVGHWVFLANCHLSLSWMPALDKIIENLASSFCSPDFRLWLSSNPHPDFPISILQTSLKMTTEPPKGLKANMKRLYNIITEDKLEMCKCQEKFRKLVFSLCWFHAMVIERKKFQRLGWNVDYSFNDSDFEVSFNILSIYLDEYSTTPWEALKYLIAAVMYGGHVTDDWDKRLLVTYINEFFNDDVLSLKKYKLSSLLYYYVPEDGPLHMYRDIIHEFPIVDQPQAFGQHPNADIASLMVESKALLATMMSLQVTESSDDSLKEEKVLNLTKDMLGKLPQTIDYETTAEKMGPSKTPLMVVLLQEIQRYNVLLLGIEQSLKNLQKGIKGFMVMTPDLENIFECLYEGKIPNPWLKAYPSMLSLGSWSRDLIHRVDHFSRWANTLTAPLAFWLSAFTFPTGFLTAVLQTAARKDSKSIDQLVWDFTPLEQAVIRPPADGVFVRGMYLEGASWNRKEQTLMEPGLLELFCPLPPIHFLPVEQTKHKTKGLYECPVYYYPQRSGTQGRAAFVVVVELKSGNYSSEFWIKRGTAILLSLPN
ncbi:dynein heavy chain [Nesidiocoris tenuis]|uniref:Dynein heavy chain n=1 Tax=Nesidiocoris tenuis TaxID=355587 RepID=A0ABN7ARI7_9HEMI|nr:dynein heavy chain [Nesidiocoris tenuis]